MRGLALLSLMFGPMACSHVPWDYDAQNARISNCYHGVTPNDVTDCLTREDIADPVYPVAFKPGQGAFCAPDLNKKECRAFLETANQSNDPSAPIPPSR